MLRTINIPEVYTRVWAQERVFPSFRFTVGRCSGHATINTFNTFEQKQGPGAGEAHILHIPVSLLVGFRTCRIPHFLLKTGLKPVGTVNLLFTRFTVGHCGICGMSESEKPGNYQNAKKTLG